MCAVAAWAWWGVASVALFAVASLMPFPAVSEGGPERPGAVGQDALAGHEGEIFVSNGHLLVGRRRRWWCSSWLVSTGISLTHHRRLTHWCPESPWSEAPVTGAGLFIGYGLLAAIGGAVLSDSARDDGGIGVLRR